MARKSVVGGGVGRLWVQWCLRKIFVFPIPKICFCGISFDLRVVRPWFFHGRIELCYGDLLHIFNVFIYCLENFLGRLKVKFWFENRHFSSSSSEYSNPTTPQKIHFSWFWLDISWSTCRTTVIFSRPDRTMLGQPSTYLQRVHTLPRKFYEAT